MRAQALRYAAPAGLHIAAKPLCVAGACRDHGGVCLTLLLRDGTGRDG